MRGRRQFLVRMATLAGGAAAVLRAQDPAAALAQPEFEVASVKPNTSLGLGMSLTTGRGGVLTVENSTLRAMITMAYNIRDHQLTGGPRWIETERWDIVARPSQEASAAEPAGYLAAAADRQRLRLRALLASRFQLAVHSETKEMPIYALVVAKNGPHLEPSKGEGPMIRGQRGLITCQKVSMKMLAENLLSQRLGRKVVDQTGINGDFDFKLQYVEDAPSKPGADPSDRPDTSNDPSGPTLVGALEEQLGLKLESTKGPVEVIVIDRVERASAN